MKQYENPAMVVITLSDTDILTASDNFKTDFFAPRKESTTTQNNQA